jgi:hypothetical protein
MTCVVISKLLKWELPIASGQNDPKLIKGALVVGFLLTRHSAPCGRTAHLSHGMAMRNAPHFIRRRAGYATLTER